MSRRVLLLSAYHGESHKRWCEGLIEQFSNWQWTLEFLPARYFSWRTRGNSLSWGMGDQPNFTRHYDLLIATSMVDLTALRGFRPELASIPTVVYFHENQFAYPENTQVQGKVETQLTSIYTALVADRVLFNSQFNIDTFILGAKKLIKKLPDGVPSGLVDHIQKKSSVIPVPIDGLNMDCDSIRKRQSIQPSRTIHILWNHRWEWDKGPRRLLNVIKVLARKSLLGECFKFHIAGQQFRKVPEEFSQIHTILTQHKALETWGYVKNCLDYQQVMSQCDVVLSTASHDFQGLSMIEAAQHGCIPLAPNDLAYPEWFEQQYLYGTESSNEEAITQNIVDVLLSWYRPNAGQTGCVERVQGFRESFDCSDLAWPALKPKYHAVFDQLFRSKLPQ